MFSSKLRLQSAYRREPEPVASTATQRRCPERCLVAHSHGQWVPAHDLQKQPSSPGCCLHAGQDCGPLLWDGRVGNKAEIT